MAKNTNLNEVKSELRCLIISSAKEINVETLARDYKNQIGTAIPFTNLGYSSLIGFLKSIPDTLAVIGNDRFAIVRGVVTSEIQHISSLVRNQKKPKQNGKNKTEFRRNVNIRAGFTHWNELLANEKEKEKDRQYINSPRPKNSQRHCRRKRLSWLHSTDNEINYVEKSSNKINENNLKKESIENNIISNKTENIIKCDKVNIIPYHWPDHFSRKKQLDIEITGLLTNQTKFWFQIKKDNFQFSLIEMTNKMKDFYDNHSKSYKLSSVDIRIGKFCVVPSDKETWRRAQIVTIVDDNNIEVFLCDYGSGCCVSNKHLYNILPEFCELPQQAFRGSLDYVTPIGNKTYDIFKELTCSKKLSACITQVETDVLLIWVVLLNFSDSKIVNEELVLKSGAKICPERSLYTSMKAFDKFHKILEKNDKVNGLVAKFSQFNLLEALQKYRMAEEKCGKKPEKEEENDSNSLDSNTSTYNTDNNSRLEEIDFQLENLTEFVYCERYYTDAQIHDLIYDEYDPCWECVEIRNRLKEHP